jgi:hypothetical protein
VATIPAFDVPLTVENAAAWLDKTAALRRWAERNDPDLFARFV